MGVEPGDVTVLGELDDVVTRTDFCVRVYVGPYPIHTRSSPGRGKWRKSWKSR